jgi:branched-chain amino acid transport system permease protein
MGINTALYKSLTFGVSALYTGVAGALGAIVVQFVAPDSFTFFLSITLLVGLVVGGVGWIPGAFLGGAFVLFVPNFAEGFSKGLSGAFYGVMIILVIYVLPTGAAGLVRTVSNHLRARGGPSSGQVPNQQVPSQQVPSQSKLRAKPGRK